MSTDTFSDLEARLREDLPRLADELLSVDTDRPVPGDARTLEPAGAGRGSRRWLVPVAAIAAAVLVLVGVVVAVRADDHRDLGPVDVGPAPVEAGWAPMATSPLSPREAAVSVWTGTEVIIWGGRVGTMALLDGAAYNPATDTWRTITPNSWGHPGAHAVWTGTEMVVLAKNGGAAYDPATDTWRDLPRLDDGSGSFLAPVWTGSELIGIGFESDPAGLDLHLTASSLDGDQWTQLASTRVDSGPSSTGDRIVWTGSTIVVGDGTHQWWSYDPGSTAWSSLPSLESRGPEMVESVPGAVGGSLYAVASLVDGDRSIVRLARLDGTAWTWVGSGANGKLEPKNARSAIDAGGRAVLLGLGTPPRSVDVGIGAFDDISAPGVLVSGSNPSTAWTGEQLIVWGGADDSGQVSALGWRWRPGG